MRRLILNGNSLAIALSCLAIGCHDGRNQASKSPTSSAVGSMPGILIDPLESDKDVVAMKKAGHWQVQGQDQSGFKWEGYLVVEQADDAYMTSGFFEWSCREAGGRYHFEGTYDPQTREVRWTGFTVRDRFGTAANAHYRATVSSDGLKLLNGSWQGGISFPGSWRAEFLHGH
jgi:hypothetical protein